MNKQCEKCGNVVNEGLNFCPNCGNPLKESIKAVDNVENVNTQSQTPVPTLIPGVNAQISENSLDVDALLKPNASLEVNNNQNSNEKGTFSTKAKISQRSIVKALIFSFLTCGIYTIYWFIKLTEEANTVSGEIKPTGGVALLLSFVTCGIYTYFWMYKQGEKICSGGKNAGLNLPDRTILYIVLTILGLGIVNYCLMQSDLNKIAGE